MDRIISNLPASYFAASIVALRINWNAEDDSAGLLFYQKKNLLNTAITAYQDGRDLFAPPRSIQHGLQSLGADCPGDLNAFMHPRNHHNRQLGCHYGYPSEHLNQLIVADCVGIYFPMFAYEIFLEYATQYRLSDPVVAMARLIRDVLPSQEVNPAHLWKMFAQTLSYCNYAPDFFAFHDKAMRRMRRLFQFGVKGIALVVKQGRLEVAVMEDNQHRFDRALRRNYSWLSATSNFYAVRVNEAFYQLNGKQHLIGEFLRTGCDYDEMQRLVEAALRLRKLRLLV